MKTLAFDRGACQDLEISLKREWLETNGLGGYCSSTITGTNTRRYHGLLVASLQPPRLRHVLLSHVEEFLYIDDQKFELSTNIYPDIVFPKGYQNLTKFLLSPFPVFFFQIDEFLIEKTIFMVFEENTTVISYRLLTGDASRVRLEVRPKLAYRDFHSLTAENDQINGSVNSQKGVVSILPYSNMPPIYFHHNAVIVDKSSYWYKQVQYLKEKQRGFDCLEDLFSPCGLIYSFLNTEQVYCVASTQMKEQINIDDLRFQEEKRRAALESPDEIKKEEIQILWRLSQNFIVKGKNGLKRIIAGYHWFEDWGRDTFVSLPGFSLINSRPQIAKDLLMVYSEYISQGMIPNRFPDLEEKPDYHTVDAALWYVNAVYEYFLYTEDDETVSRILYPQLKKIITFYRDGTRFHIHMDRDGLISAGDETTHLTWMDAAVGNNPVTSRHGKAVEINALWYNALKIMEYFGSLFKDEKEGGIYRDMAFLTKESFNELFWNKNNESLYDVIRDDFKDDSVRPNQIFSISLPFAVLDTIKWKSVLKKVEDELLTPVGLRSLSPKSPDYRGVYSGNPVERDQIYHQGCVWPWLIAPFILASLKTHGRTKSVKLKLLKELDSILAHVQDNGLGYISEIFDGDPPHHPRGAIAQAWNVAEILRSYVELVKDEVKIESAKEFILR